MKYALIAIGLLVGCYGTEPSHLVGDWTGELVGRGHAPMRGPVGFRLTAARGDTVEGIGAFGLWDNMEGVSGVAWVTGRRWGDSVELAFMDECDRPRAKATALSFIGEYSLDRAEIEGTFVDKRGAFDTAPVLVPITLRAVSDTSVGRLIAEFLRECDHE